MPNLFFMFDLVLVVIFVPLRLQQGTDGQGNLLVLHIHILDGYGDGIPHLHHLGGMLDTQPGEVSHAHAAVHATQVHKDAEVGDGLDNAGVDLANLHFLPELLGQLFPLGPEDGADGAQGAAALGGLSSLLLGWLPGIFGEIPFLQIGLPAVLSVYFDVFSGFLQAFIFAMLTMLYVAGGFPAELYAKKQVKKSQKKIKIKK